MHQVTLPALPHLSSELRAGHINTLDYEATLTQRKTT